MNIQKKLRLTQSVRHCHGKNEQTERNNNISEKRANSMEEQETESLVYALQLQEIENRHRDESVRELEMKQRELEIQQRNEMEAKDLQLAQMLEREEIQTKKRKDIENKDFWLAKQLEIENKKSKEMEDNDLRLAEQLETQEIESKERKDMEVNDYWLAEQFETQEIETIQHKEMEAKEIADRDFMFAQNLLTEEKKRSKTCSYCPKTRDESNRNTRFSIGYTITN